MRDANRWMDGILMFSTFFWSIFIYNTFYFESRIRRYDFNHFEKELNKNKREGSGRGVGLLPAAPGELVLLGRINLGRSPLADLGNKRLDYLDSAEVWTQDLLLRIEGTNQLCWAALVDFGTALHKLKHIQPRDLRHKRRKKVGFSCKHWGFELRISRSRAKEPTTGLL